MKRVKNVPADLFLKAGRVVSSTAGAPPGYCSRPPEHALKIAQRRMASNFQGTGWFFSIGLKKQDDIGMGTDLF